MNLAKNREITHIDIRTVDINTLKDVDKIEIDRKLPKRERWEDFVKKIENPFCYICNGMVVKTSYSDTNDSLENKLVRLCRYMDGI